MARDVWKIDAEELIKQITGFQRDEENFEICRQFLYSNFKYHRFLSVDPSKVDRIIEGLTEKFYIHAQDKKSELFAQLVQHFLDQPIFDGKSKTDIHYSILSLLFNLANSPTNSSYTATKQPADLDMTEKFDWAAYLLEGEDIYQPSSHDSDETNSLDSSDDECFETSPDGLVRVSLAEKDAVAGLLSSSDGPSPSVNDVTDDLQWLNRNVMFQYWKTLFPVSVSDYVCEELSSTDSSTTQLTEFQVIREVLWLLCGCTSLAVFVWDGHSFTVSNQIGLSHLSQAGLRDLLHRISHYGDVIQRLNACVSSLGSTTSSNTTCQTYQAFASAICDYLTTTKKRLLLLEEEICEQEESLTLMDLIFKKLPTTFTELDLLDVIYNRGVVQCQESSTMSERVVLLMDVLQSAILDISQRSMDLSSSEVALVFSLWNKTLRPYLDIIDKWLFFGRHSDPCQEFLLQRSGDIRSRSEDWWHTSFSVQKLAPDGRSVGMTWLEPMLQQILVTGKSMELLRDLNCLHQVISTGPYVDAKRPLYDLYLTSLKNYFNCTEHGSSRDADDSITVRQRHQVSTVSDGLMNIAPDDRLLTINFQEMLQATGSDDFVRNRHQLDRLLSDIKLCSNLSLEDSTVQSLRGHVTMQYRHVCSCLVSILKQNYRLLDCLASVKSIFLMQSGHAMYEFCTSVFSSMSEQHVDLTYINSILQEVIRSARCFIGDEQCMYLTMDKKQTEGDNHILDKLSRFHLHYEVPWPLSIVMNESLVEKYNEIFVFLLQIKCTKYLLENMTFEDQGRQAKSDGRVSSVSVPSKESVKRDVTHRLQLFRNKLLYFVNSLHSHIMNRLSYSASQEFDRKISEAIDLDQIIIQHNSFVNAVHERCMLHREVAAIKNMVVMVFKLSGVLGKLWNSEPNEKSLERLAEIELRFSRSTQFLASMLVTVTKRGSFPQLQSLAYTLSSCHGS